MNPIRLFILRLRAIAWTAFAISCIGVAVLIGLASLVLPYAERFRPEIQALVAERLGRPVRLERVSANWTIDGPELTVHGLEIGDRDDPDSLVAVDMAKIGYDIYGWLWPNRTGQGYFRLMSDHLEVIRQEDGAWSLSGLGRGANPQAGAGADWLFALGGLAVGAREVLLVDEGLGRSLRLENVNVELSRKAEVQRISLSVESPEGEGRITAEAELTRDADGPPSLRAYLQAADVDLAAWLGGYPLAGAQVLEGEVDLEAWIDWGDTRTVQGSVELVALVLGGLVGLDLEQGRVATRYALRRGASGFRWQADAGDWRLDLTDLVLDRAGESWPGKGLSLVRRSGTGQDRLDLAAEFLRVEDLTRALVVFDDLSPLLRRTLYLMNPRGDVHDLVLQDLEPGWPLRAHGEARVVAGGISPWRHVPGLDGIGGRLVLDGAGGYLDADAREASVEFPGVLRWPLQFDAVRGRVAWRPVDGRWRVDIEDLEIEDDIGDLRGRLGLVMGDGTRPVIDLLAEVTGGRVAEARRFWPVNRFNPVLVQWLDRALVSGDVERGRVVLYGDLDDWPFAHHEGRFDARARVRDAVLDYHDAWPPVTDLSAELRFDSRGMSARSDGARVDDVPVEAMAADLPRFRVPRVDLEAETTAPGNALLALLRNTPIQDSHGTYIEALTLSDDTRVRLDLELPFGRAREEGGMEVSGHLLLDGNRVHDSKWDVAFDATRGRMDFSDRGLVAEDLATVYRGHPAALSFWTGEFVQEPGVAARGRLVGEAPAAAILDQFDFLDPLLERIPGASRWEADLVMNEKGQLSGDLDTTAPWLTVTTDLEGAAVELPEPFTKIASGTVPVVIRTLLPDLGRDLNIEIGDLLELRVRQEAGGGWRGVAHFGPGPAELPEGPGLRLDGRIEVLDLDQWRALLAPNDAAASFLDPGVGPFAGLDIEIGALRMAGREFGNLSVKAARSPEYWNLRLEGDEMKGSLRLPLSPDGDRLVLAEFERLEWPAIDGETPDSGLRPDRLPPLRFFAEQVDFLGIPAGTVNFESYPTASGMHVDQLETRSETLTISASGDWTLDEAAEERSRFSATVSGEDFGGLLAAFGFSKMVDGGQSLIKLDAGWPGAPSDFELARLEGELSINIGPGEITEVKPGAGRLFGLLNLAQIPRRLRLDFSDLFKSGMVFDSIQGRFELDSGDAYTGDLVVSSPTAEVLIQGRTGLVEQDYDQVLTVVPKVGQTLPVVGALAGGGAGAVALLLVQGLFGGQIERITQYHYSVNGPWAEPAVELLGANDGQVSGRVPTSRPEG